MELLTLSEMNSLESLLPYANERELTRLRCLLSTETDMLPMMEWAGTYLPHRMTSALSKFHIELAARLDTLRTHRAQKLCHLAPRGSAKTTWATLAYPLREAVERHEPYTMLIGDTQTTARGFLDNIKWELETNRAIERDYPNAFGVGPVWNQDIIRLRNGCVIEAISTGAAIRGRLKLTRPTLIVADDLQGRDDIISAVERQRAWDWFTADLLPLGEPTTNVVVNGTAIHRESIVYRLLSTPGWQTAIYKALIEPPERVDLWDEWERILHDGQPHAGYRGQAYYDDHKDDMDAGAELLWPERFPLYDLMLKMVSGGPAAFGSEYQNNPTNPELNEWPEEYFDEVARPEFRWEKFPTEDGWPADIHIRAMWLDPAKGRKDKLGDYSAIVLFGGARSGQEYIKADLFRGSAEATVDQIIRRAVKHVREFNPDVFGFEDVLFQSLYGKLLREALNSAGLDVTLLPSADTTDKDVRIRRLTNPLVQRKMRFFRDAGTQLLVEQLRDFGPAADKKDGPDALESARRTAWRWLTGNRRKQHEETQFTV